MSATPATLTQPTPQQMALAGSWTAAGLGPLQRQIEVLTRNARSATSADAAHIDALDSAGAWVLQNLLLRLGQSGQPLPLQGLEPRFSRLLEVVATQLAGRAQGASVEPPPRSGWLQALGRSAADAGSQALALLAFVGETAITLAGSLRRPQRLRWRPVLYNIRSAGFDALPIVGMLAWMLGIVVSYQGADQLRRYGANIFVADLIGLSILREFGPLITAIIVAGRSGSAYAAQIGTMTVTEEIDALRTLGIVPIELLVLPKLLALVLTLPLLTVFADVLGVAGGMVMAQIQLDVGATEFLDRFTKAVSLTAALVGIGKAAVFAVIIVVIGCFQGFRTAGGAESVGRQTTRSVVQSIFLVIVADGLFSVVFSALGI